MALGFVKKIFSFGRKEVEEVPAEDAFAPAAGPETETTPPAAPAPAGPQPEERRAPEAATSQTAVERAAEAREAPGEEPPPEVAGPLPDEPEASFRTEPPETSAPAGAPETPSQTREKPVGPPEVPRATGMEVAAGESPTGPGKVTVSSAVEHRAEAAPEPEATAERKPWFQRLREGLSRSSRELSGSISGIFLKRKLDEETLQDLEDVLLRADLGLETAMRVTDSLSAGRYGKDISEAEVRAVMAEEIEKVLTPVALPLELDLTHKPHVILVVGVNGTGKTTTIGKLAAKLRQGGLSVTMAAGDTFRAAAIEQLKIWGERTGSPVVASKLGADAAGLAWDAYDKAKAEGADVLVIDTAGRLQNKAELMAELEKIVRVLGKHDPEAPHTVLQTVDATTGQNALNQVEIFKNVAGVNGLVMTKLDGTARGGILVSIAAKHKLPVYFIGVGEQVDDLEPFSAGDFARAIAGVE